jgi:hypothetical protein
MILTQHLLEPSRVPKGKGLSTETVAERVVVQAAITSNALIAVINMTTVFTNTQKSKWRKKYDSVIRYHREQNAAKSGDSEKQVLANQPFSMAHTALAMNARELDPHPSNEWLLDTCASYHITPCKDAFCLTPPYPTVIESRMSMVDLAKYPA